ncbi:unnamed protein product [Angiostrongylus costaricensis]|uniref:C2H2-type domain-containing protein n=1 Tax=Angiostrongylus costaricensis TaxID=334426 RepID=A0A0R3P9X3_ANGCS|nr:unnamed protein product [Angiostrongylus costaricensis]
MPPSNLRRQLVRNRLYDRLCATQNCMICPSGRDGDCMSSGTVYLISCKAFEDEYVGEAGRPLCKVAWQWNAVKKAHEFVLTVIGLEDLVERRSSETIGTHSPDFFCRLCALVIPRQSSSLEAHVRSLQHVLFFVHKYHPDIIMEMDSLAEGGMQMRKILAQLLKRHEPKSLHCIPIYDPVGEQKRKAVIAMQRAKDAERHRQLPEVKHAEQQRLRNEEKHRKQCEVETHQEERKLAERGRKEKGIHGRTKRPEEEVNMLNLHKEAARKAKDEKQTMEESEREVMEAERLRRQDELRMLLVQEKQRLKALQVKEATQRHLLEEKDMLERKIHELERCHEDTVVLHKIPALEQDSRSSFHMGGHPTYPINKPRELHQQLCFLGPDSPNMRIGPVLPPTPPFSISPSGMWKSQESVSQTVSKPFVPIASTSEEQTRVKEARTVIGLKVKQSELVCQDTTFRPSLRDRKVDPYISNGNIIQTRDQLVDFIWRQGAERIPINELPVKFNQKAAEIEGVLGIDSLYEVVCVDCSDLDTFYCSMCGVWTTPNDMFEHLETTGHKLAYLFRNYKMYHQTIVSESNFLARSAMLNQFAIKIWKMEQPPGKVSNRLRSLLDRATIERIWPECTTILDHSWKDEGITVGRVEVPPPISKKVLNLIDEESVKLKEKEKYKDKKQFVESISVKKRDKHYPIPKKRGKEKDEREKEESLHSRKHLPTFEKPKQGNNRRQTSPDRKRHRSRSLERRLSWEASAAAFLTKLGDRKGAALVSQPSGNTNVVDEKLKQWRNTTESQPTAHTSSMVKEFLEHQERLKKLQELRTITESDEKAQMRKLLGVLITMQQEAERCGSLDKSMVDKLYKEVGLKKSIDSSDQLLAQLCSQISQNNETSNRAAIELQSFGIINPENLPLQTSSSILGGGFFNSQPHHLTPQSARPSLTQTLLDEVKRSLGKLESARQLSPIVRSPPFVITNRDDMFQGTETIPYIYPGSNSIGASESTNQTGLASNARAALPSSVTTQDEKASGSREQLFENSKQLRKQAAEENVGGIDDDDDWDCLAEVISGPSPFNVDFGKSSKMHSNYKRDDENNLKTPIASGQKMPLARTILPNGEALPSATSMQHEISKQEESSMEQSRSGSAFQEMSTLASNRLYLFKNTERSHMIRDALKKKCAEKLREKRMNQFASRRNMECIVRETVSAEVKSDFGDLDENVLLELYESITNSLIQEQYEDIHRTEEERLAADVDEFMNPSVYCPSCLLSPLSVDERSAKCQARNLSPSFETV